MEKVEAVAGLHRSQAYSSVDPLLLSRRPERVLVKRIPHAEGVKAQDAAVCRTFAMLQGEVNLSKKVWEKLIQLIETSSDTRIGLIRAARRTLAMDEKIMEDERKRLRGEKWFRFLRGAGLF